MKNHKTTNAYNIKSSPVVDGGFVGCKNVIFPYSGWKWYPHIAIPPNPGYTP